jgi:cell division protein YceG involved in septum cleavage
LRAWLQLQPNDVVDFVGPIVQTIVHALAVIGAAGLVWLVVWLKKRITGSTSKSLQVPPQSTPTEIARQHAADTATKEQRAIQDAVRATNAAERLADIGNRRRKE